MTHNYTASVKYFDFLVGNPRAWQLIFPISTTIVKNDTINVIEVDVFGVPTGNSMTGTVIFPVTNDNWTYRDKDRLVYVSPD